MYSDFVEPYEYDWNTEFEFEDANHIIGSIITDLAGNQFEIPSISVFVNNIPNDNVPPTISISNPVSGQTVSGTINFTVNVDDNVGIAQVEFFIDGYSLGVTEEPYSYLWDTTLISELMEMNMPFRQLLLIQPGIHLFPNQSLS